MSVAADEFYNPIGRRDINLITKKWNNFNSLGAEPLCPILAMEEEEYERI
jgi:hypothetical protein